MTALLMITLLPALMAAGVLVVGWRPALRWLALLPPAAALVLAWAAPEPARFGALVLGMEWSLAGPARTFLLFTSLIWLVAAWQAARYERTGIFLACFLLCMSGSLAAVPAVDGDAFYVFYALASVAAYGLIAPGGRRHRPAARLYLALALLGEFLFLAGVILERAGEEGVGVGLLVFFGLGAKLGVIPLHVALAPAYRAAPAAGGAVLAAALLSVAALGWLRFLPLAGSGLPGLAPWLVGLGLAAALGGAALGMLQRDARALLGYSSMSQMGVLSVGVGCAALAGWSGFLPVLTLFALHHGLVKGSLLLGMDAAQGRARRRVQAVMALLSLALAGLPLTGGAFAKGWMEAEAAGTGGVAGAAAAALPLSSMATVLLMARFVWLLRFGRQGGHGDAAPMLALAAAALIAPWIYLWQFHPHPGTLALGGAHLLKATLPLLFGLAVAVAVGRASRRGRWRWRHWLPPGDLAVWLGPLLRRWGRRLLAPEVHAPRRGFWPSWGSLAEPEAQLLRLAVAGVCYLLLVLTLAGLAVWEGQ